MSEWIPSYASLRDHPKLKRLCRILAMERPAVVGYLHYLWWWAMDYAPDGDLSRYTPDDIADAIDWDKDASVLLGALRSCGFVDGDQLHDWDYYGGKLHEQRSKDAERKKTARKRTSDGCPADVQGMSGVERKKEEKEREDARGRAEEPSPSASEKPGPGPSPFLNEHERELYFEMKAAQQARDRAVGITDGR